jgi:glycosyltransferase involved in cell wall biosynthesis
MQKTYVQHAQRVIVPSDYLKRILMGWSIDGTKIHVIHNAPQIPVADTHQTIQLEQIAANEVVLCTVARLVPWKGIDHVLEVLGKFSHLQFRYLIVGIGPDKARLEKLTLDLKLQHKVVFMGAKTAAEVSAILNRSKLFILLSKYEGLPHVILEALLHRIPCLTSNAGGFPEVVNDQNGLMFNLNSPDFKATLQQTLEQFILGQHALNRCKPVLDEKFRFEEMIAKTKNLILR